jgi:hypothetical protein
MEKEFLVKIHKIYRWVVAICDKELGGLKIEEGNKQLDLSGNFFKGEPKSADELKEIIRDSLSEDSTFNIIGKKSCQLCKEIGLIEETGIKTIDDIPYALILL